MGRERIDPNGHLATTITASITQDVADKIKRLAKKYFGGNVSALMRDIIDAGLESLKR